MIASIRDFPGLLLCLECLLLCLECVALNRLFSALSGWKWRPLVSLLVMTWAFPATAQIAGETTYYAPNPRVISVPVIATVGGHCGFAAGAAPSGTFNIGEVDGPTWTVNVPFTLDCTGPSRVAVVSASGGMFNTTAVSASGYGNLAPYDVTLNLVGSTSTANQSCAVSTLTATAGAPCTFRGPVSTTQGLFLNNPSVGLMGTYLQATAPVYPGTPVLIEGSYSDTLTVTVSAAI